MAYVAPQPPYIDGTCSFTDNDTICMAVQTKLNDIRTAFQPSADQQVVDTFYITATYNSTVAGTKIDDTTTFPVINGDTAEHCLALFDTPLDPMGV
jgi:hypothetical protein